MAIERERLEEIIAELLTRPGHEKVRSLLYKLFTDGLEARSRDIDFEQQLVEISGRIDALLGRTIIEVKSDLRREAYEAQLAKYLTDKKVSTGSDFVGICTDGATFYVHQLAEDGSRLEKLGDFTPKLDEPHRLLAWLESVVALHDKLPPDVERIKIELGRESVLYQRALRRLRELWARLADNPEVTLKRQLWDRLLRVAYGSEVEAPELFLQHTYLVIVAKAVATAALIDRLPPSGRALLDGDAFADLGILGAVEGDFFDWLLADEDGDGLVLKIAHQAARFELGAIEADVLKGLYESLIDPEQRHFLGEYYTPDWLAARIVAEAVDKPLEQRVIDPACGSGTFLFHAIRRLAEAAQSYGVQPEETVRRAARQIAGIDIHPVAVIFARATWLLAVAPTLNQGRPDAFSVPVYLGDALQWHGGDLASEDFEIVVPAIEGWDGSDKALGRQVLRFPKRAATNPNLLDQLIQQMLRMAERDRPVAEFQRWLEGEKRIAGEDYRLLANTYDTLAMLQSQGRNHIWGYIARNMSRPVWLAGEAQKADVVIGNPPWVAYSRMDRGLKQDFKKAMRRAELWGGTGSVSGFDLSAYFFARAMQLYLRRDGLIAFVLPYASMFKKPYANFRKGRWRMAGAVEHVRFVAGWKLGSDLQPLFPVPASVWFARFANHNTPLPETVTAFSGNLIERNPSVEDAAERLTVKEEPWPAEDSGEGGSDYRSRFRDGALLYPRRLVLVERQPSGRLGDNPKLPRVRGRAGNQDKKPWKDLEPPAGPVEAAFIRPTYLGENVYPYRIGAALESVIPIIKRDVVSSRSALASGAPRLSEWLEKCETLWDRHGQGTRSFAEQLDYFAQLTAQFPAPKIRVVYAKAGKRPAAAIITDDKAVIDHMLYWSTCSKMDEARYLTAILNSETARARVEKWQAMGQWGARHFDKAMFNLPIPLFDAEVKLHRDLATAAEEAERVAAMVEVDEGDYFVTVRKRIRVALAEHGVAQEIDRLVEKLLGPVG